MTGNVGGTDRVLRILVGLALLALVFVGPQTPWGWNDGPLGYALVAEMDRGLLPQVAEQVYRQLSP